MELIEVKKNNTDFEGIAFVARARGGKYKSREQIKYLNVTNGIIQATACSIYAEPEHRAFWPLVFENGNRKALIMPVRV